MRALTKILIASALAAGLSLWTTAAARGESPSAGPRKGGTVELAKKLRHRLLALTGGQSLAASLDHNREEWAKLSPDQRDKYRREALAFAGKSQEEQEKLLKHYEQFMKMPAQQKEAFLKRQAWLGVVVAGLSQQEKEELQKLSPDQRAKKLLDRKAELIRLGKLQNDEPTSANSDLGEPGRALDPTTAPASQPSTRPAAEKAE